MRYYDIVLGLIPVVLAGITATLLLAGLELTVAVPAGSLAAIGLIGHAMFVRTPVDAPHAESSRPEYRSAD